MFQQHRLAFRARALRLLPAFCCRIPHLAHRLLAAALLMPALPAAAATTVAGPAYADSLRNFSYEQGLPQASVNALLQSHDGYLWVGTFGGLARFDGRRFRIFHADLSVGDRSRQAMTGPASERIVKLLEDRERRLWVATQDAGISLYQDGRFHRLASVCGGDCQILSLHAGNDGAVWVLTPDDLYHVDVATLAARRLSLHGKAFARLSRTDDGSIWLAGASGLARVRADTGGVESVALPGDDHWLTEMVANGADLWLFSSQGRLYRYLPARDALQPVRSDLPDTTQLVSADNGRNYVSDRSLGIRLLDDAGNDTPLTGSRAVHALVVQNDNAGNTWLGTPTEGMWRLRPSRIGLMSIVADGMNRPGRAITGDGDAGLWFGMGCGGLHHWNRDGGMHPLALKQTLGDECINSLLLDQRGELWIAATSQLGKLSQGKLRKMLAWPRAELVNIWQSRDGSYWLSDVTATWQLQVDGDGNVTGRRAIAALDGMNIATISDSRRGGIWLVGNRGAYRLLDGKVVESWAGDHGDTRLRQLRSLFEDDDGSLWIGSYGGGLLHIKDGKVRRFDESSGMFDNTVSCLLPDDQGRLWLAGNRGLTVLRNRHAIDASQGPDLLALAADDGLNPPEVNGGSVSTCYRDARGRLWISLMQGVAMIDPARFENLPSKAPGAYIEQLRIDGSNIDPAAPVVLGPKAANLEIAYAGIELAHPELLRYRYRIDKTGDDWIETGSNRTLLLANPPWGRFRFEVQASVLGGPWSPTVAVEFHHPLPWYRYQSVWLLASLAALLALLRMTRNQHQPDEYLHLLEEVRLAEAERPVTPPTASGS
ncbi:MAG: two-component regulator propeller domain-containing protein [Pseudoxanthomonas sp.]